MLKGDDCKSSPAAANLQTYPEELGVKVKCVETIQIKSISLQPFYF